MTSISVENRGNNIIVPENLERDIVGFRVRPETLRTVSDVAENALECYKNAQLHISDHLKRFSVINFARITGGGAAAAGLGAVCYYGYQPVRDYVMQKLFGDFGSYVAPFVFNGITGSAFAVVQRITNPGHQGGQSYLKYLVIGSVMLAGYTIYKGAQLTANPVQNHFDRKEKTAEEQMLQSKQKLISDLKATYSELSNNIMEDYKEIKGIDSSSIWSAFRDNIRQLEAELPAVKQQWLEQFPLDEITIETIFTQVREKLATIRAESMSFKEGKGGYNLGLLLDTQEAYLDKSIIPRFVRNSVDRMNAESVGVLSKIRGVAASTSAGLSLAVSGAVVGSLTGAAASSYAGGATHWMPTQGDFESMKDCGINPSKFCAQDVALNFAPQIILAASGLVAGLRYGYHSISKKCEQWGKKAEKVEESKQLARSDLFALYDGIADSLKTVRQARNIEKKLPIIKKAIASLGVEETSGEVLKKLEEKVSKKIKASLVNSAVVKPTIFAAA
ncbi:MAG: hypothetical protein WCG42_01145 [Parachlamydiaceae bacterium]